MRTYTDIPGWFSEEWLYDRMIDQASHNATFVEVGCWLGKSTAYCASRIRERGKSIAFYAVDTWQGSPAEPALMDAVARAGGSVYHLFRTNMEEAGVMDAIRRCSCHRSPRQRFLGTAHWISSSSMPTTRARRCRRISRHGGRRLSAAAFWRATIGTPTGPCNRP
jgi:hypothetical protein